MNRQEFINNACRMGYCTRPQAEKYCGDRETFTEDDYIGVFTKSQSECHNIGGTPLYGGGRTSKRYFREDD